MFLNIVTWRFHVLLVAAICLGPFAVQSREFHSSDVHPFDYPTVQAVAFADRLIRERSDGRLSIGTLGHERRDSENFTLAAVKNASIDMARINVAAFHSTVPETTVLSLPFLFHSVAHLRSVLDGPIGDEILAAFEDHGFIGLCFYDTGMRSVYGAKPVRVVVDLKGTVIRVPQSRISARIMEALGAKPILLPYNQVYTALAAGTIDAAENNLSAYVASQHYSVAKVYSLIEYTAAPSVLVFSKRVWDTLPPDDQGIIRGAARDSVSHFRALWEVHAVSARRTAEAAGVQLVTDVDKHAFGVALLPLHQELASSIKLQNLVQRIRAMK